MGFIIIYCYTGFTCNNSNNNTTTNNKNNNNYNNNNNNNNDLLTAFLQSSVTSVKCNIYIKKLYANAMYILHIIHTKIWNHKIKVHGFLWIFIKICFTIPIRSYARYGSGLFYTKLLFVYFLPIAPFHFLKKLTDRARSFRSSTFLSHYFRFKSLPNDPRHLPHLIKVNTIRPSTRRASNEKAATATRTQKRPTKSMALRGRCSFPPQVCFGNHRSSIDWTVLFSWCFNTDKEISCSHGMPCLETPNP